MNNAPVNNETIVNYLLGSLPEAETDRLDELSITDDEFAVALNATEKDLVDAYVQGELTGAALERFRTYYLASPLRRGRLSFAKAFDAQAEKHSAAKIPKAPAEFSSRQKRQGRFAGRSFFTTPRLAWRWGFAVAAIALLVAGIWLVFENMRLRQQVSETQVRTEGRGTREQQLQSELERHRQALAKTEQELARVREERERVEAELTPQAGPHVAPGERNTSNQRLSSGPGAIPSFILTPQMRGVQQLPTISVPVNTEQVTMQLELDPNDYSAYRVALVDQAAEKTVWRSRQLKPRQTTRGKALSITFPANLLRQQVYVLRAIGVTAAAASDVVGDYPFRVVKQ